MNVTVTVDCSPEEARAFLGLPDVRPMQEALMKEMEQQLRTNMKAMDPETIMRTWLPASMQGAEQLQKMFWGQVQQALAGAASVTSSAVGNLGEKGKKKSSAD